MNTSIATRECPGCSADLTGTHHRRVYCSEPCRKQHKYSGTCSECGGHVPYSGTSKPADRCAECKLKQKRLASEAHIINSIHDWISRYGEIPSACDWNISESQVRNWSDDRRAEIVRRHEDRSWPWLHQVQDRFGSWSKAIEAAGLEAVATGVPRDLQRRSENQARFRAEDRERALLLRDQGASFAEVARQIGCSETTAYRIINGERMIDHEKDRV